MTFGGKFRDSLVVEQLDKLSVSFLVDELEIRRGGVAAPRNETYVVSSGFSACEHITVKAETAKPAGKNS